MRKKIRSYRRKGGVKVRAHKRKIKKTKMLRESIRNPALKHHRVSLNNHKRAELHQGQTDSWRFL